MLSSRCLRRWSLSAAVLLIAAAPALAVKRRAFVTSVSGTGDIASWPGANGATVLDQADAVCRARALAGALPNPLTYRAWLSTSTTDAYCHVQGLTGQRATGCNGAPQPGGGPWYLRNGITTFTASLAELTGPERKIYRSVVFDEAGTQLDWENGSYWTGTAPDGTFEGESCADWTSASASLYGEDGHAHAAAGSWTGGSSWDCNYALRLLCLEPGASEETVLGWTPGALAFVTSATGTGDLGAWPQASGATGLAAGDAICRNLAAAAHLPAPDTFVAWLSDGTTDARDRVTVDAAFRRVDAYPIALSRADLLDGSASNSLHVDEQGRYVSARAHTGTFADGTSSQVDCDGWTDGTDGFDTTYGGASLSRSHRWTEGLQYICSMPRSIYCFSNVVTLFWDGFESTGDTSRWSSVAN